MISGSIDFATSNKETQGFRENDHRQTLKVSLLRPNVVSTSWTASGLLTIQHEILKTLFNKS